MLNPRLAVRYAKSLMDIAIEQQKLDAIYNDMLGLKAIFAQSRDFVMLMRSPIVKADKKSAVVKALTEGKVDPITDAFINLIVGKGREFFLEEIVNAFIGQYKIHNRINDVKLTTAAPLDEEMKKLLEAKVAAQFSDMRIELSTQVDERLLGGFVLEANNNVFDASVIRDLNDIKKQFLKNEYIPNLR